jgi:hypothetical protein
MNEYYTRINRVIDYIENNIAHDFTLDELAGRIRKRAVNRQAWPTIIMGHSFFSLWKGRNALSFLSKLTLTIYT